jgi:uncharacterized protein YoxC
MLSAKIHVINENTQTLMLKMRTLTMKMQRKMLKMRTLMLKIQTLHGVENANMNLAEI